jgi:transmembrane sensor
MESKKPYDNTDKLLTELDKLHTLLEVPYSKDKQEIWEDLQPKTNTKETKTRQLPATRKRWWAVAATLVVLLGLTAFLRFYAHTLRTPAGKMATVVLPDGSIATLNAQSQLTYYPLWWKIFPKIKLAGEAFFEGHHRRHFSVTSTYGTVTVLGTRFDVYARNDRYRVVCFSGKVRVTSRTKNRIILTSGEKAEVSPAGEISFFKDIPSDRYNAWTKQQFVFTSEPLSSVFAELARRYGVQIEIRSLIKARYTGNFSQKIPVEQALRIVCKPFGLTFVKTSESHFIIQ